MLSTNIVSLPIGDGDTFSFEELLKLNSSGNWQQRFHKMLCDALRPQLQQATAYYGKLVQGGSLPQGASYNEDLGRWTIHLDALPPQCAEELLWVEAHQVPRSIIPRPEFLELRSRLADQVWRQAGVESHLSNTPLDHYHSFASLEEPELLWRVTSYCLGIKLRDLSGDNLIGIDATVLEAMLVPGTDYFFVTDNDSDSNEAEWLRIVLVGLMLP